MQHEVTLLGLNESIKALILGLKTSEDPVVFRASERCQPTRSQWVDFLRMECGLEQDKRHYLHSEELVLEPWWEISNQPDRANSYAYSTTPQPFHSDNAWFPDPAEINFFVMDKQAVSGGEQLIYPVSRLVTDLQRIDPGLLADLTETPVTIRKGDGKYQHVTPVIVLQDGPRVFWNYYRTMKDDLFINELCERFFLFLGRRENSYSVYSVRCESGDSLVFNDQRLLHARTEFLAKKPRDRVLYQSMWRLPFSGS